MTLIGILIMVIIQYDYFSLQSYVDIHSLVHFGVYFLRKLKVFFCFFFKVRKLFVSRSGFQILLRLSKYLIEHLSKNKDNDMILKGDTQTTLNLEHRNGKKRN